jgi:hypothetical protein
MQDVVFGDKDDDSFSQAPGSIGSSQKRFFVAMSAGPSRFPSAREIDG